MDAPNTAPALETGSVAEMVISEGVQASTVAKRNLYCTTPHGDEKTCTTRCPLRASARHMYSQNAKTKHERTYFRNENHWRSPRRAVSYVATTPDRGTGQVPIKHNFRHQRHRPTTRKKTRLTWIFEHVAESVSRIDRGTVPPSSTHTSLSQPAEQSLLCDGAVIDLTPVSTTSCFFKAKIRQSVNTCRWCRHHCEALKIKQQTGHSNPELTIAKNPNADAGT